MKKIIKNKYLFLQNKCLYFYSIHLTKCFLLTLFFLSFSFTLTAQNKDKNVIWINPEFKNIDSLPEPDLFIPCDKQADVDMHELKKNIIYPDSARRENKQGKVVLRALIDETGNILRVIIEETVSPLLTQAALNALIKTKFKPGINNGITIKMWISIPFNFKLK